MRIITDQITPASFISRPNRFVVHCEVKGRPIDAYLPNPGRLWELLIPGSRLQLIENGREGRMPYTVIAVEKGGKPILLHTHLTNAIAEMLLRERLVPGFEDAEIIRREASFGDSRFDFLLARKGRSMLLEVKNGTLFRGKLAMFPDAVTARGSRHLKGLAEASSQGVAGGVLFIVNWFGAEYFMPDLHTDFFFARTLLQVRESIEVKAIALDWHTGMFLGCKVKELVIPWQTIDDYTRDRGCYVIILKLASDRALKIGELGTTFFRKGYYLYAGSARKALTKRIERHRRKRKNLFWHIDYLREGAEFYKALALRTPDDLECVLAQKLKAIADWSVKGFGSSDCVCESHLFGMKEDPTGVPAFIDALYGLRMASIEEKLLS
jgi:sugar fermentation stimulation protein A